MVSLRIMSAKLNLFLHYFPQLTVNILTQETIERMPEIFNSEAPTLTPYLTSSSTSSTNMMSMRLDKDFVFFICPTVYQQTQRIYIQSHCVNAHILRMCPENVQQFPAAHSYSFIPAGYSYTFSTRWIINYPTHACFLLMLLIWTVDRLVTSALSLLCFRFSLYS